MQWFKKHVNWTWIFVFIASGIFSVAILISFENTLALLSMIGGIVIILISLWLLKHKHQNWTYVFILLVPFGWILLLSLKNYSEVIDIVDGKRITRPRYENE